MNKRALSVCGILLTIAGLYAWLVAAMDYGDSVAVGKYTFSGAGETSNLLLNSDHTFQQTLRIGSNEQQATGTWHIVGEGGIAFSNQFLPVLGDETSPDGTTFCDMDKALGLFVSLRTRQYYVLWYGRAEGPTAISGTYTGDETGVSSTLVLNPGHTFTQTILHSGIENHATGRWQQDGNGTVNFSQDFLKTSGQPLAADERASAMDPRGSNLQVEISKAGLTPEPVFRKSLF